MVRKISLIIAFSICLLLAIYATANQNGNEVTICDFVQTFKIVNRPTKIIEDHIRFIQELPDFGDKAIGAIKESLPIERLSDFEDIEYLGEKKIFLLRILFSLEGDEPCLIDTSAPEATESNNN